MMKKLIITIFTLAMTIVFAQAQNTFSKVEVTRTRTNSLHNSGKGNFEKRTGKILAQALNVIKNSSREKSGDSRSAIGKTKIKTRLFHLYYINVIVLIGLFLAEFLIEQKERKHLYQRKEMLANICIGIGMFLVSIISRGMVLSVFYFIYYFKLFTLSSNWFIWILAFFFCDLTHYWYHRTSHKVSWFWAAHSVHHSSKEFNISVSFRQSWMTTFSGHFLFYLWLPLLGFEPFLIYSVMTLNLFYQSWLHTELIGKLHPVFEWLFNTPSHHRVHHACDLKYLDKNHGEVLIIWDRLFGTFQEEEEKPTYGLTEELPSANLSGIMWSDWKSLFAKAFSADSLRNSLKYLIKPPGWSHDGSSKTVKELRMQVR